MVDEILDYRKSNPLSLLMVLVPSDSLRRRLKVLLVNERHLNLLNLHILTFHQLSLRLFEELPGANSLNLRDDAFLEEVLRQIIRMGRRGTSAFVGIDESAGGCAALWQALRDLKDGMVEPARALEALNEGHFGRRANEKNSDLFVLFHTFLSCCKEWGIRDYSDLDIMVMEQVHSSKFLNQFSQIFYYGFYDLTQVQADLFHSVARRYPTTLLFPLVQDHPGWSFAQRFYERYVQGLAGNRSQLCSLADDSQAGRGPIHSRTVPIFVNEPDGLHSPPLADLRCTILSCFGARDEVVTVAKEILRLVLDEGIAFHEIGVVARDLEPYVPSIKEVFPEHCIPVTTSAQEPLVQFPLVKTVLCLINLASRDYVRSHFIDLTSSPFFNIPPFRTDGITPRPDLWDLITRRLGITKGLGDWHRLERHLNRCLTLAQSEDDDGDSRTLTVSAGQLRILWGLFTELQRDLSALPIEASWSEHVRSWKVLLQKYLGISDARETHARSKEEQIRDAILNTLDGLAGLDAINPKVRSDHFIQTYQHWLERFSVPLLDWNVPGVAILDAMAARGVPFRALFVLGLNEGMFPRIIREDPFLRDDPRRILQTVLGYKVGEKLAAFDEERLLFTLLVGAARERLYCFYQRSDETGRALTPSWYLTELRRALDGERTNTPLRETTVPRGIMEKREVEPFTRNEFLPPQELAVRMSLESQDPTPVVELLSFPTPLYKRGRQALGAIENSRGPLSHYDGVTGPLLHYWNELRRNGLSPTALELYALCPFKFFARSILDLNRWKRPEEMPSLGAAEMGLLCHTILKSFFQELNDQGYFDEQRFKLDLREVLENSARKAYFDYELEQPVGYPIAWEVLQEELTGMLAQAVAQDLQELSESGYRPVALEIDIQDSLQWDGGANLNPLSIRGRLDRIDFHLQETRYRVVDYKFRMGKNRSPKETNLLLSALRGQRLQPPFYVLLAKRFAKQHTESNVGPIAVASFYFLAPKWGNGPLVVSTFPENGWEGQPGEQLKQTIARLIEGVNQGRFFIHPGDYCKHCEVSEVCRKNHYPTRWRAENDSLVKPQRDLRLVKIAKDNSTREKMSPSPKRGKP
ncbi:MAG: PD-(D/E)XK nuclease family protein [Candidatus Binatia bacterium]